MSYLWTSGHLFQLKWIISEIQTISGTQQKCRVLEGFLKEFYFEITLDLEKSYKTITESSCRSFTQPLLMLTPYITKVQWSKSVLLEQWRVVWEEAGMNNKSLWSSTKKSREENMTASFQPVSVEAEKWQPAVGEPSIQRISGKGTRRQRSMKDADASHPQKMPQNNKK